MKYISNASLVVVLAAGCANGGSDGAVARTDSAIDGTMDTGGGAGACPPCVTDADCAKGSACAQFAGDIYCAPLCPKGDECSSDRACSSSTGVAGDQVSVCIPRGDVCGSVVPPSPDASAPDTSGPSGEDTSGGVPPGDTGGGDHCGTLVGPSVAAGCTCASGHTCGANGCYSSWWCDTATNKCHAPPGTGTCGGGGTDAGPHVDSGPGGDAGLPTGTVGPAGGTTSRLYFTVVGDTRPPVINDTKGYPVAVIDKIYSDIAALSPVPLFSVSTGDYCFAQAASSESGPQIDMYMAARARFPGAWFPAIGNHECTGAVTSNCGPGTTDGLTVNYTNFMSKMLGPIGKSEPYYSIRINATDGSWTSKFVFVAANAWSTAQQTWLDSTLAAPTTYTFVIRHEPAAASTAPGVKPSEAIMAKYPYTLSLVGHTHTYGRKGAREVVIGNGGAPLTGTVNFGFALLSQRADGAIRVDMIDYSTGASDPSFGFAVHPDGSPAP